LAIGRSGRAAGIGAGLPGRAAARVEPGRTGSGVDAVGFDAGAATISGGTDGGDGTSRADEGEARRLLTSSDSRSLARATSEATSRLTSTVSLRGGPGSEVRETKRAAAAGLAPAGGSGADFSTLRGRTASLGS